MDSTTEISLENIVFSERSVTFMHMKCPEKVNNRKRKLIDGCEGLQGARNGKWL